MRLVPCALLGLALAIALAACTDDAPPTASSPEKTIARVGESVLTEEDIAEALGTLSVLDSATARRQIVEQWIQRELIVQEARRQGLDEDDEVRERLRDSERAVLEAAFIDRFFETTPAEPSDDVIAAYYEANQDRLALREPYLRVHHLRTNDRSAAETARDSLATAADPSAAFTVLAQRLADDPDGALALAKSYVPQSDLMTLGDSLMQRLRQLSPGGAPTVVESGGHWHLIQLVDRMPAGATPTLSMVRADLRDRLAVDQRTDMEARLLQQLRSEARARGHLEIYE